MEYLIVYIYTYERDICFIFADYERTTISERREIYD